MRQYLMFSGSFSSGIFKNLNVLAKTPHVCEKVTNGMRMVDNRKLHGANIFSNGLG